MNANAQLNGLRNAVKQVRRSKAERI